MAVAFTRQLGSESGVQLNPLRDESELPSSGNADQICGIMMRATRGRIDKPFRVDRGNVFKKLGYGEQMRVSALNEAWVHVVEGLNNGVYEFVVQRLTTADAKIKHLVIRSDNAGGYTFTAEENPKLPYLLAIKHNDCFNDGIKVEIYSDEVSDNGTYLANDVISFRLLDSKDNLLCEYTGSLKLGAKDDYGQSFYLPDVISNRTESVSVDIGCIGDEAKVNPTDSAYGYNEYGKQNWVKSDTLICFDEGSKAYTTQDFMRCREALEKSVDDYAYISSGGSKSIALLAQLAQLAYDTNRQLVYDLGGDLDVEASIAFANILNLGASKTAHLIQQYWSPLKSDDPTGVNPKGYIGTATFNIALRCARNAQKNSYGFAPKHYPIAGRNHQIMRTNITQTYTPSPQEKNQLAKAKIIPVISETYTGGSRYVFFDSITAAKVENSLVKLVAVADMSTDIDERVTRYAKDLLQLPIPEFIKRMNDALKTMFERAEASGWLVPSADPRLKGASYLYEVKPNEEKPYDAVDVSYWMRYTGTTRQVFVTQTLVR